MQNNNPKVILLLAGEGKRLRPYTIEKPKCMVEINGKSLIDSQIKILRSADLDNFILIGGYKAEMLKYIDCPLIINSRYASTNMVWSLFCAEDEMDQEVIVSYGDIIYSKSVLMKLINSSADIAVVIDKDWESYWKARNENPLDDAETLRLRDDGTISEIGRKPVTIEEIQGQYIGLMKFSVKGLGQIKKIFYDAVDDGKLLERPVENSYMTDLLQAAIEREIRITAIPINGDWVEVDTVSDLNSKITIDRIKKFL